MFWRLSAGKKSGKRAWQPRPSQNVGPKTSATPTIISPDGRMMRRRSRSEEIAEWHCKRQFVGGDSEDYSTDDDDGYGGVVNIEDEKAAAAETARLEEMLSQGAQTGNVALCREAPGTSE
jgi:hypothetical protein